MVDSLEVSVRCGLKKNGFVVSERHHSFVAASVRLLLASISFTIVPS